MEAVACHLHSPQFIDGDGGIRLCARVGVDRHGDAQVLAFPLVRAKERPLGDFAPIPRQRRGNTRCAVCSWCPLVALLPQVHNVLFFLVVMLLFVVASSCPVVESVRLL